MPDDPEKPAATPPDPTASPDETADRGERGITDFVRRALSVGVEAAARSKDDLMRAAGAEIRSWLERLNVNEELARVLARMVIEVKTEVRFRPAEDGKLVPQATNEVKVKGSGS